MKNRVLKTMLAVFVGVVLFCAAAIFYFVDISDDLFFIVKDNIHNVKEQNSIKKESKIGVNNIDDFYGLWKDTKNPHKERFEALIDNDSITLYKYNNDNSTIYWVGTFDASDFMGGVKTIGSKNFSFVSNLLENAAKSEFKEFTFEDGKIKFISQYNDDYKNIELERYVMNVERLRVVKYPRNRKSYYDENTNKTLNIGGYQISYPSYYDHSEEETEENIIDKWMVPEDYKPSYSMINNNHLVYSPSSTDAYAELFIGEYVNANIESIEELDRNIENYSNVYLNEMNKVIVKEILPGENYDMIRYVFSNRYDDVDSGRTTYGMIFETYMLMKETNTNLIISIFYNYDDTSDYDYLADYAKILKNIKKVN